MEMRLVLLGLVVGLSSAMSAEAQQLGFALSSNLEKADCAGDDDGDCLDNFLDSDLAFLVAPHYFYDGNEDEGCWGSHQMRPPSSIVSVAATTVWSRPSRSPIFDCPPRLPGRKGNGSTW